SNGKPYCWGRNSNGQLGNGNSGTDLATPTAVNLTNVTGSQQFRQISGGERHTCALTAEGTLWCWGQNIQAQLGTGASGADVSTPTAVQAGTVKFSAVTAGSAHSCALGVDGTPYCWGQTSSGRLGIGDTAASNVFV